MKLTFVFLLALADAFGQVHPVQERATQNAGNPHVQVYLTPRGKTYHTYRDCTRLEDRSDVLTSDESTAQAHGLTLCVVCAHKARTGGRNSSSNSAWAKPEAKK